MSLPLVPPLVLRLTLEQGPTKKLGRESEAQERVDWLMVQAQPGQKSSVVLQASPPLAQLVVPPASGRHRLSQDPADVYMRGVPPRN